MKLIQHIKDIFFKYKPIRYKFAYNHFLNSEERSFYEENGYVVIKNIVTDDAIQIINDAYTILKSYKGYYEVDGFITSANYGYEIQQHIHDKLSEVNNIILPKLFNTNQIYSGLLNVLVIKFNKDRKEFYAHQDIPLVEETVAPTTYAWIPTTDINEHNGALLVLPKSHKWFRWQRTHDQSFSPLQTIRDSLIEFMIPLYISKGDLILFDNSLIHASAPNLTNETRIAMNTGIAPSEFNLVHYQKIENNVNEIKKYFVDTNFWLDGHYLNPSSVPDKYCPPQIEKYRYKGEISKSRFIDIMK